MAILIDGESFYLWNPVTNIFSLHIVEQFRWFIIVIVFSPSYIMSHLLAGLDILQGENITFLIHY